MTPSNPLRDESGSTPLESTAHIMDRITRQLGSQLALVSRDGRRRTAPAPAPVTAPPPALVVVAHGSRDPRALATVTALIERVRELRPGLTVRLGHIELNEPLLTDTLAAATGSAVLVPLLLSRGYHVKHDIPEAAAGAPHLDTRVAAPLGPHPLLVDALHDRLLEAGWPAGLGQAGRRTAGVILAAAGSRDPDSATDTRRTAYLLAQRLGVPVVPAYASPTAASALSVPGAVRALAARGRHRTAVASYFTAPGRFATQCADAAPWIAAAPLGAHPAMARLLLHRYDQARAAAPATQVPPRQLTSA
ncbi:sirohydrochlorin chelatase [Streptomyces sp. BA2]|uniref:sirohydrochlorin chelatase n=1 Tax=Streptomyces sp. BA2 TaxID=436595 RepID=UPI001328D388|nr:sirohydrochlorin chelatase [Streptomyces sp. BA2]MWA10968.1 sirohydrochlorin chelatase [Streptomyces sp. BA2]